MSARMEITPEELNVNPFHLFADRWFLLTAGDFAAGKFNPMTVSWGYLGVMWRFLSAIAVVRPQRYTFNFIRNCDGFTLSAFDEQYRGALQLCGARSGRELDKVAATRLTPEASRTVTAPGFKEAVLVLECRKVYQGEFLPEGFTDRTIPEKLYPDGAIHHFFAGEITRISGTPQFRRTPAGTS